MRERWLLQGMAAEEGEARRKQLEQDEEQGKRLEDQIHRWVAEMLAHTRRLVRLCFQLHCGVAGQVTWDQQISV